MTDLLTKEEIEAITKAAYTGGKDRSPQSDVYLLLRHISAMESATPSPGKADAEDAARWRHARKAFWINGDPADVLCSSDADKAIDADMERDSQ